MPRKNQPPEYLVWSTMKTRCKNTRHHTYPNYGGKGITVCQRWDESFDIFLADMGPRPEGYTLDRIDSAGNYEPENCRWATRQEQNNNRRTQRIVEYRGKKMSLGEARILSGCPLSSSTLHSRINYGWDVERALTEPLYEGDRLLEVRYAAFARGRAGRWGKI